MSTPLRQNVTFPIGRLVWGKPSDMRTTDKAGKPLVSKSGAPRTECAFGVAFPKNGTQAFWQTDWGAVVYQVGRAGFPNLFQADGTLLPGRKFSFKVIDGDSTQPNENGNVPAQQEGYAGNWIVAFKSQFAPSTYRNTGTDENPVFVEVPADQIKTGHFVRVAGSVDSNGDQSKPGVYVNHNMVVHAGIGQEIVSGPDPVSAFKGKASAAPAGMQALPAASLPGLPNAGAPAPGVPAASVSPPPANFGVPAASLPGVPQALPGAPTAVVPNTSILGVGAPAAPVAPAAPSVPAGPVMTAKANGVSYDSFRSKGWTDETLRQHGYMV